MNVETANLNLVWADLIIQELVRLGVDQVVISPGSRSTPLVIAAAQCETLKKQIHFDERGAAFFALGHARATGRPAALICTSGTAVANYLPAVIEASQDRLPLIVLSADRPPELRDTGANQTMHQPDLFGRYVRFAFDMPCPTIEIDPAMVLTTVDHAVYCAVGPTPGPVHLNCMFREPLTPADDGHQYDDYLSTLAGWRGASSPFTKRIRAKSQLSENVISEVVALLTSTERGLTVVGRLANCADVNVVKQLTVRLGWPVIADIQSQLRLGAPCESVANYADLVLTSRSTAAQLQPDVIVHVGDQLVSKRTLMLFDKAKTVVSIVDHPLRHDPLHRLTHCIEGSIASICARLGAAVPKASKTAYASCWKRADGAAASNLQQIVSANILIEPSIAFHLSKWVTKEHALFLASSLAIRDLDMFAVGDGEAIMVGANRGASGIDGTISSAAGYAGGAKRPVTVLIGDLALLHDINSLDLVRRSEFPITIIVVNNDGGGIFGLLPIADSFPDTERYFVTPHGLHFDMIASQFGLSYSAPAGLREFERAYRDSAGKNHSIIELVVDRQEDREARLKLVTTIDSALNASPAVH